MKQSQSYLSVLARPLLAAMLLVGRGVESADLNQVGRSRDMSLKLEVKHALDRAGAWLLAQQAEEGFWSEPFHPAVTGLVLTALTMQPEPPAGEERVRVMNRGYRYLLDSVQPDGGIYKDNNLPNYNTSVSLTALVASGNPDYDPVIRRSRQFLLGLQSDYGEKGVIDDPLDGGFGYGDGRKSSDLSNTVLALEALYYSKDYQSPDGNKALKSLNIKAALAFLQNCQNLPSHNPQPWASNDPSNKGGFVYSPGSSKAGEMTLESGRVALRSYSSISYAGLLSYIYVDLDKDDPRVKAVMDWLSTNYTLDENPGMGQQGLYYYFHTLSKALTLSETKFLETAFSGEVDWRKELSLKLINLQGSDGSWANENGRWWEKDPILVTAYAMIALERIHQGL